MAKKPGFPKYINPPLVPEKKGKGRPTKLTEQVIAAFKQVVLDNVLFCTDEDLVILVNDILPEDQRFTYEAFSKWKRAERQENNPLYSDFVRVIKKALVNEKTALLKSVQKGDNNWQARAWILERKFDEWNIKTKSSLEIPGGIETYDTTDARNKLAARLIANKDAGTDK